MDWVMYTTGILIMVAISCICCFVALVAHHDNEWNDAKEWYALSILSLGSALVWPASPVILSAYTHYKIYIE